VNIAFFESCSRGHLSVVEFLFDKCKSHEYTILMCAINNHPEVLKFLLEHKVKGIHEKDDEALWLSAKNGWLEVVGILLKYGANVHGNDDDALKWSAENGYVKVVDLLLKYGANIHAGDDFALRNSANNGHIDVVKLLLDHGANIHARNNWFENLQYKYPKIEKLFFEKGVEQLSKKYPSF
jgi:ankyrin repeat protein